MPTKEQVREDVNLLFRNAPPSPVGDKPIEVCVVSKRCVYLNNYRIAGGKPWASENLPSHTLKTSLKEVLSAFSYAEVRAALKEAKDRRAYLAAYHAQSGEVSA